MHRLLSLAVATFSIQVSAAADLPPVSELPSSSGLPDPLVMLDGTKVTSKEQWFKQRRPELKKLFQHYMYGYLPERPKSIRIGNGRIKPDLFGGKAIKKEFTLTFGPKGTPPIELMVILPNKRKGPVPAFAAINFCGNHTALKDPSVSITKSWYRGSCPGCEGEKATEAGRGGQADVWNIEMIIDRGYAIGMFYYGDVDPDKRGGDFTDGVHPHFFKEGQTEPGKHDWGAIASWAYGVHRVVDYMEADPDIDNDRIAVVGHSRLGKTSLLAAALDERIALVIPHQAGCGGTAPSRGTVGESVERINTVFPHWFNDTFPEFNKQVDRLPFDQHCLVALCAPRPVLFSNAQEDQWANPNGQFDMLVAASPVYEFLGVEGMRVANVPELGKLVDSRLGYYIRKGKHSMTTGDWKVFLDFADRHFRK